MFFVTKNLILVLFLLTLIACEEIKFDPVFHAGDSTNGQIVPREPFPIISCFDPEFDQYACMHVEKIKELKEILIKAGRRCRAR